MVDSERLGRLPEFLQELDSGDFGERLRKILEILVHPVFRLLQRPQLIETARPLFDPLFEHFWVLESTLGGIFWVSRAEKIKVIACRSFQIPESEIWNKTCFFEKTSFIHLKIIKLVFLKKQVLFISEIRQIEDPAD